MAQTPFVQLSERIATALEAEDALDGHITFLRVEDRARERGLDELLTGFRQASKDYFELREAFEATYFRSAAEALLKEDRRLGTYSGQTLDATRRSFKDLDRKILKLAQRVLAAQLMTREPPEGVGKGPRGTWTERSLLRHQVALQKRHAPLRSLVDRAGRALIALKPCLMMSPMSVAQYLVPGRVVFDVVVIDEASQMRPEDALGGIARGRQLVVVGDPQQLPPTSFFEKVDAGTQDEDEIEELGLSGQESILDLARSSFGAVRTLNWHYRSRHDSLIAFSNREFYEDRLVVFPSPHESHPQLGVQLVAVDGVYTGRRNEPEADAILAELRTFIRSKPDWSLAIVTMNAPQQELLTQKLDRECAIDPVLEAYRAKWATTLEPLIVKNLENVQGDERDAVLISTVYGPDESGAFAQRFGPINSGVGHRRLNVLFTRAKYSVKVFSSMSPDAIRVEGSQRGVRVLRDYLLYARDRKMPVKPLAAGDPESEFEAWFQDQLGAHGYETVPQYGVAGFRIDLAVRDPAHPETFLLGVECDGASYHSSKSARERDRLREEILEKLGWRLHRIWSTDWFRNPERELELLLKTLQSVRRSRPTEALVPRVEPTHRRAEPSVSPEPPSNTTTEPLPRSRQYEAPSRSPMSQRAEIAADALVVPSRPSPRAPESPAAVSATAPDTLGPLAKAAIHALTAMKDAVKPASNSEWSSAITAAMTALEALEEPPWDSLRFLLERKRTVAQKHGFDAAMQAYLAGLSSGGAAQRDDEAVQEEKGERDPLADAVGRLLPPTAWSCSECGGRRRLWVGKHGPFLKCVSGKCVSTESIPLPLLRHALGGLGVKCPTCGGPSLVQIGKAGAFVGCTAFPACAGAWQWKNLREHLLIIGNTHGS